MQRQGKKVSTPHASLKDASEIAGNPLFSCLAAALPHQLAPATQLHNQFTYKVPEDGTQECAALFLGLPAQ